jgi:hypothetical protein
MPILHLFDLTGIGATLSELRNKSAFQPGVARRASQPWAGRRNAFGIKNDLILWVRTRLAALLGKTDNLSVLRWGNPVPGDAAVLAASASFARLGASGTLACLGIGGAKGRVRIGNLYQEVPARTMRPGHAAVVDRAGSPARKDGQPVRPTMGDPCPWHAAVRGIGQLCSPRSQRDAGVPRNWLRPKAGFRIGNLSPEVSEVDKLPGRLSN